MFEVDVVKGLNILYPTWCITELEYYVMWLCIGLGCVTVSYMQQSGVEL